LRKAVAAPSLVQQAKGLKTASPKMHAEALTSINHLFARIKTKIQDTKVETTLISALDLTWRDLQIDCQLQLGASG